MSDFFVYILEQNSCQFVCVIMHNFTNLMCIFFAGLTRTATKIGGDLLPHPQTPFLKTELRFHSFLSRHCSYCVPPSRAPKPPLRHDPFDVRNVLHWTGAPHHDPSNDTSLAHKNVNRGEEKRGGRRSDDEFLLVT